MPIVTFCHARIQGLTEQFLEEKGSGLVLECSVLTYLEVSAASRGFDPDEMWDQWVSLVQEQTGTSGPLSQALGDSLEGRRKLVEALRSFEKRYMMPTPRGFSPGDSTIGTVKESNTLDEFGLLFGDEDT